MVVSHPRSGTHFLINSIASSYGYVGVPWLDLDPLHHTPLPGGRFAQELERVYYSPDGLADYLLELAKRPLATIIKSHHPADFFEGVLPRLTERYVIFVVHRHPVDTLISYWRFLCTMSWPEGPKPNDPVTFAKAEPCGGIMRFHMRQYATMMHRWAAHADGWLEATKQSARVVLVRYDQLKSNYSGTMQSFAAVLGQPPQSLEPPDQGSSVWFRVHFKQPDPQHVDALRKLCRETIGETMDRLGYE